MAAIPVTPLGTAYTPAAANAGGDTLVAGTEAGGWGLGTVLVATVGANSTIITIDGVAQPAFISGTAIFKVSGGVYKGRAVPITYSQVVGLTVGAASLA